MDLQKGDHVFITIKPGTVYEGIVGAINTELKRVRLENIIKHPEKIKLENYQRFDFEEILDFRKFENPQSNGNTDSPTQSPDNDENCSTIKIPVEEYQAIEELQKNYRYIKNYDTNFHSAMNVIEKCDRIAITMQDVTKGRRCRGSVIAISTGDDIFLFDIEVMGDQVFDKGLRKILESEEILKIVHDCRLLSDCLLEKHLTNLKNVLDVEANDVLLLYIDRQKIREHTRSLHYLIEQYLGLQDAVIKPEKFTDEWKKRPLEIEYQDKLAVYVSYLIPLQKAMENWHLKKVKEISDLYNNFCKSGNDLYLTCSINNYTPKGQIKEWFRKQSAVRSCKKKVSEEAEQS